MACRFGSPHEPQGLLRRASASSSAPSSMLRTACARRPPTTSGRAGGTCVDRGDECAGKPCDEDDDATSAGTRTMIASSLKSLMPRRRARTDASTTTPWDRRLRPSVSAESSTEGVVRTARGVTGAELLELLGGPLHDFDDLGIPLTSGPGTDDVAGCEDRQARELHESSPAPSLCCLSEEIPALPAVRPARPPTAIKPAFSALPGLPPGRSNLSPSGTSKVSLTESRSRCSGVFLLSIRISGLPPFSAWCETPS
jgi:hypothetical protein